MVRVIERKVDAPKTTRVMVEVNVSQGLEGPVLATIDVVHYRQGRIGPEDYPDPLPPREAYLLAIACAERLGIDYVCVRDPQRLFPPEIRPVREVETLSH